MAGPHDLEFPLLSKSKAIVCHFLRLPVHSVARWSFLMQEQPPGMGGGEDSIYYCQCRNPKSSVAYSRPSSFPTLRTIFPSLSFDSWASGVVGDAVRFKVIR